MSKEHDCSKEEFLTLLVESIVELRKEMKKLSALKWILLTFIAIKTPEIFASLVQVVRGSFP
jgi:hypothetical protein